MSGRTEDYRYDYYKGRRLNKRGRRKKKERGDVCEQLLPCLSLS